MYTVEFYEEANGKSELWEYLEALRVKAATNKDARIQFKQSVTTIFPERSLKSHEDLE